MKQENNCKDLNFSDCELSILRMAVDKAEKKIAKRVVNSDDIKKIIKIVEDFIQRKNLICYGGTAINNILPEQDKFYNKEVEIPDYDFFTPNALQDAIELANIYYKLGFTDVEAKSGQHHGTYKVFVNYIPVADITHLPKDIYNSLKKDSIRIAGILYAPPNFLRMSMYLELSRPAGDTSRWEKVLKRLSLLNKNYPLNGTNCDKLDFQRKMDNNAKEDKIYENVKDTLIHQGVVFFGGFANTLYSQYMPSHLKKKIQKFADFDVLSNDPESTSHIIKERLKDISVKDVKIIKRQPVGEIIPLHYEIKVDNDTIAFIYKPIACHSYNTIDIGGQKVKVATIDTMLSFYLAFLYADRPYYNEFLDRILCMSKFLFEVQQKNRLAQKGLLRRFSVTCYGHQESVEEMRASKAEKFKELKKNRNDEEFREWFLNYKPDDLKNKKILDKETSDTVEKTKRSKSSNTQSKTLKPSKASKTVKAIKRDKTLKQSNTLLNIYNQKNPKTVKYLNLYRKKTRKNEIY
jgi:hypothetical protein